jgi:hypothetical protein
MKMNIDRGEQRRNEFSKNLRKFWKKNSKKKKSAKVVTLQKVIITWRNRRWVMIYDSNVIEFVIKVLLHIAPKRTGIATGTSGHISPEVVWNSKIAKESAVAKLHKARNQLADITSAADIFAFGNLNDNPKVT